MKKLMIGLMTAGLFSACGARDDKNKTENYPTYDTTVKTENINDSGSAQMHGSGDKRHNLDESETGNR
jgi:hypothetical protein